MKEQNSYLVLSFILLPLSFIYGWSKRFRCEARKNKDESGRMKTEISAFSFHNSSFLMRWAFFNSLLLAIFYLLCITSFAASNPFDDASAAYARGDYVQAMKLFRELADKGH